MSELHFYIVLSTNGYRCRGDHKDTHVHCKDRLNDNNAMWVFYEDNKAGATPVEPQDKGTYYIKNYGTGHWINAYEKGKPLVLEMQSLTKFIVVKARDGFELHFDNAQKSWTVNENFSSIVFLEADEGMETQMFRFARAD